MQQAIGVPVHADVVAQARRAGEYDVQEFEERQQVRLTRPVRPDHDRQGRQLDGLILDRFPARHANPPQHLHGSASHVPDVEHRPLEFLFEQPDLPGPVGPAAHTASYPIGGHGTRLPDPTAVRPGSGVRSPSVPALPVRTDPPARLGGFRVVRRSINRPVRSRDRAGPGPHPAGRGPADGPGPLPSQAPTDPGPDGLAACPAREGPWAGLVALARIKHDAYNSRVGLCSVGRRSTMIDEMTRDALRVSPDVEGMAGPYLMVSVPQLDAVLAVLDRHKVRYWVDADAISLDNEPAITVINFGRTGEAARIQAILDEAG